MREEIAKKTTKIQVQDSGLRFRTKWAEVENLPSVNHVSTRGCPNWSPVLFCPNLSEEDSGFRRLRSSGSLARQWGINIHSDTRPQAPKLSLGKSPGKWRQNIIMNLHFHWVMIPLGHEEQDLGGTLLLVEAHVADQVGQLLQQLRLSSSRVRGRLSLSPLSYIISFSWSRLWNCFIGTLSS